MSVHRITGDGARHAAERGQLSEYLGPLEPWLVGWDRVPVAIPSEPGSVVILCEGLVRPFERGLAIPAQWVPGTNGDGEDLPEALHEIAERVRRALGVRGWSLRLHEHFRGYAVDLTVGAESAALPLALSLHLTTKYPNSAPAPSVLATGGLRESDAGTYVASVQGYAQKVAIAARLLTADAMGKRWLVAPRADANEARKHCNRYGIDVVLLHGFIPDCLDPALARFDAEPQGNDLEALCEYANRPHVRRQRSLRSDFYVRRLAKPLGERLRASAGFPRSLREVDRLLLPVSELPDNALLSIWMLRPRAVLLVVSQAAQQAAAVVEAGAREAGATCERLEAPIEDRELLPDDVARAAAWLSEGRSPVTDLTPGTREMMVLCAWAAARAGASAVYVKTATEDHAPRYGDERLILLPSASLSR